MIENYTKIYLVAVKQFRKCWTCVYTLEKKVNLENAFNNTGSCNYETFWIQHSTLLFLFSSIYKVLIIKSLPIRFKWSNFVHNKFCLSAKNITHQWRWILLEHCWEHYNNSWLHNKSISDKWWNIACECENCNCMRLFAENCLWFIKMDRRG